MRQIFPKGKNKKKSLKDEFSGKIIKFVELRAKAYSYLIDDGREDKKETKKCVIKRKLKFQKLQKLFRSNSI